MSICIRFASTISIFLSESDKFRTNETSIGIVSEFLLERFFLKTKKKFCSQNNFKF